MGFVCLENNFLAENVSSNARSSNIRCLTRSCLGYLCSALTTMTRNDPDTYVQIMRLCSEVSWELINGMEERKKIF